MLQTRILIRESRGRSRPFTAKHQKRPGSSKAYSRLQLFSCGKGAKRLDRDEQATQKSTAARAADGLLGHDRFKKVRVGRISKYSCAVVCNPKKRRD